MEPIDDPFEDNPLFENTLEFETWWESNDVEVEESEDEMCNHEDHKEVVPLQEMRGGTAMGFGGQFGTSEAVIVCKKCAKSRPVDRVDQQRDKLGF